MKYKVEHVNFDESTGISYAVINTKYGDFIGTSQLHEEDESIVSTFAGCRYAEIKAQIKCLKSQLKEVKADLRAVQKCYNQISQNKRFNTESYEASKMRKYIHILQNKQNKIEEEIATHEQNLQHDITYRVETLKRYNKSNKGRKS